MPQYLLVIKLPLVDVHINQPPSDLHGLGKVDVVVPTPEASEDGCDVEWAVPHDVELMTSDLPVLHVKM